MEESFEMENEDDDRCEKLNFDDNAKCKKTLKFRMSVQQTMNVLNLIRLGLSLKKIV